MDNIVEVRELSRRFGHQMALDHISLDVRQGYVYGLVGANGAGKTTLMRHLLGLLKAEQGTVRVFGLNPVTHPVSVLQRIGYLSEEREMPEWMRIDELMRYTAAFHSHWDNLYACELLSTFRLPGSKKIRELSKGMRAQVGLVAAVAHRPDLLLLDEPSTGLDAVVRKDILNAIVRTVADDGRTAIFSSHLLDEVELMSDYVFMFDGGQLIVQGSLDDVKAEHQQATVRFSTPYETLQFKGLLSAQPCMGSWNVVCHGKYEQVLQQLSAMGGEVTQCRSASLQEIFVARAGHHSLDVCEV